MTNIQIIYDGPIVNRGDAKSNGFTRYFTGKHCVNGHIAQRHTSSGQCVKCNDESHKSRRSDIKRYKAQYYYENKGEINRKNKEWRDKNPEKSRVKIREWLDKNPERVSAHKRNRKARVKNAEGSHSHEDVTRLLLNQNHRCAEPTCKANLTEVGYHVDHIMPLALGGSNFPENLQCLCPRCNLRKGAKHPDLWDRENGR